MEPKYDLTVTPRSSCGVSTLETPADHDGRGVLIYAFGDLLAVDARSLPAPKPHKKRSGALKHNPCFYSFGPGPSGKRCKHCRHLIYYQPCRKRYYKCKQRRISFSEATDHRANWKSCGKFEEVTE